MKQSKFRRFLRAIGPGFITGAADDDPSGIGTYAQTGAAFGYTQLWFALFVTPFMIAVQEMCGRIGLVTGKGLSGVMRRHYSPLLLTAVVSLLFVANTVNIGADLGAMADAMELVTGMPSVGWLFAFTMLILVLEVFVSYCAYAKVLKVLCVSLLAYVLAAFTVTEPWTAILRATLLPSVSFTKEYLVNIVALFGTTISPYLFFWQADEEVEEEVEHHQLRDMGRGRPHITRRDITSMRLDTAFGMVFSNLMTFFIITTAATTLGSHGIRAVATAAEAAAILQPLAGRFASLLFAAGIIGTGLLAVPILAGSASYAISEAFGWKEGLFRTARQAPGFYAVIVVSTAIGLLVNLLKVPAFQMLYFAAILNGIIAPPLLVIILLISNNRSVMGARVNTRLSNVLGWSITLLMSLAAGVLLLTILF
ncbi:MAG: divalent metal cation transporter [Candidatus Peribacteraceae bacterium]|nr:divalent metal cation transporter [Candidatus Peribacteraceae bacterium]MDD5742076.1 divalent metal cation transporter [Candidatus Peribacteraceae bacterium]